MDNAIIIAISLFVIIWALATMYSRQQLDRVRKRGLWPPLGEIPTDDDVKRLVNAGEKVLAIRMCRQIHNLGLAEAKAVVDRLAKAGVGR